MTTHPGLGRQTEPIWHRLAPPDTAAPATPAATPAAPRAHEPLDTQLARAVRQAAQMRTLFYATVLLVALTGQVIGATNKLDVHLLIAIPAVATLELGGVVVMANADVRRRLGERAIGARTLSAAVATAAVAFNWLSHDDIYASGFFSGMSALGYLVWLVHVENLRRDRLRATGALPPTAPAYELMNHWIRHPRITRRAQSLAKSDPRLGLYDSFDTARAELRRQRRDAAIAKVLRRKIRAAVDPATATIAEHVYDLNEIAARLSATADYDGLAQLIAIDLTPARIARESRNGAPSFSAPAETPPAATKERGTSGSAVSPPQQNRTAPILDSRDRATAAGPPGDGNDHDLPHPPPAQPNTPPEGPSAADPTPPDGPEPAPNPLDATQPAGAAEETDPPNGGKVPDKTAAAVAYWLTRNPEMGLDELAQKIGKAPRTVRRYASRARRKASDGRRRT
ncbi:hypothetical protein C1I95_19270 [Micromonospora craterilacus]|uniref:DUF2637 domain-containing protein n=1 Tax=Micromonospora craterilacus TaxID=1655439 RepID=A0A2W2DUL8_9ACTN|nr:hypothetical protein [Micromonospora craterilacus]PZG15612.1 hypothetical protein C1I95_19270 [Micromonospora craterilacus]